MRSKLSTGSPRTGGSPRSESLEMRVTTIRGTKQRVAAGGMPTPGPNAAPVAGGGGKAKADVMAERGRIARRAASPTKSPSKAAASRDRGWGGSSVSGSVSGSVSPSKRFNPLARLAPKHVHMSAMEEFDRELQEIEILKEMLRERFVAQCKGRMAEGHRAATQVQSMVRGRIGARRHRKLAEERARPEFSREQDDAGVTVQCFARSRFARDRAREREAVRAEEAETEARRRERKDAKRLVREAEKAAREAKEEKQQELDNAELRRAKQKALEEEVQRQVAVDDAAKAKRQRVMEEEARTVAAVRKEHKQHMSEEVRGIQERAERNAAALHAVDLGEFKTPGLPGAEDSNSESEEEAAEEKNSAEILSPASPASSVEEAKIGSAGGRGIDDIESIPDLDAKEAVELQASEGKTNSDDNHDDDDDDDDEDGDSGLAGLIQLANQTKAQAQAVEADSGSEIEEQESPRWGQSNKAGGGLLGDESDDEDDDDEDDSASELESPDGNTAAASPSPGADYDDDFDDDIDIEEVAL